MDDRYDEEVRRLTDVLARVVRTANRTRQSLEIELGLSSGYLSKILGGMVDLKARHILAISEAAGMDPANFFALAFPLSGSQSSELRRLIANVQAALGQHPVGDSTTDPEFDEKVRRALARLLGLRLEGPESK